MAIKYATTIGKQLHALEVQSLALCYEIEKIGASTEQTNASVKAADLHTAIQQVSVSWDRQNASSAVLSDLRRIHRAFKKNRLTTWSTPESVGHIG